jgi:hypothetical protein
MQSSSEDISCRLAFVLCPLQVQCCHTFQFIEEQLVVPKRLKLGFTRQLALCHVTGPVFAEKERTPAGPLFIPHSFA